MVQLDGHEFYESCGITYSDLDLFICYNIVFHIELKHHLKINIPVV